MRRRGVTLIELMVALAITMIMMGAVVTLFGNMTTSVTDSRAVIELSERLRSTRNRLQLDLAGHTATAMPTRSPEADEGYLEIIEGPLSDWSYASSPAYSIAGDADDVLMLTVRSRGEPFVGRMGPISNLGTQQSTTAEVIWFALPNGKTLQLPGGVAPFTLYTLYRRVLLVLPQLPAANLVDSGGNREAIPAIYNDYDISIRNDSTLGTTVSNTLGDLTKRENRYWHFPGSSASGFPFQVARALPPTSPSDISNSILTGARSGEDVILTDVLAFDIKVFDPAVPIVAAADGSGLILTPNDPGYQNASGSPVGYGAFVNLQHGIGTSYFAQAPSSASQLSSPTYDTGSMSYEQNGIDEDNSLGPDQGTNGFDDDGNGVVDDQPAIIPGNLLVGSSRGERETLAPYPVPLRGVQVTIRAYETDSRQVRQVTVTQDFLPE
jgi:prepilin-type N-terminal cleavage/methylation domain-containing protein